jgi:hypothetical protein
MERGFKKRGKSLASIPLKACPILDRGTGSSLYYLHFILTADRRKLIAPKEVTKLA